MSKFITLNVTSGYDIAYMHFSADHITLFYSNKENSNILITYHLDDACIRVSGSC